MCIFIYLFTYSCISKYIIYTYLTYIYNLYLYSFRTFKKKNNIQVIPIYFVSNILQANSPTKLVGGPVCRSGPPIQPMPAYMVGIYTPEIDNILTYNYAYIGLSPLPVRVTTRIITFLVGNPYKPSFPLLLGGGTTQCIYYINEKSWC